MIGFFHENASLYRKLKKKILVCPIWLPIFFLFFYNEPESGAGIDPEMALTPLPSSIGQGSNPQPSDCEPSALPLDHSIRLYRKLTAHKDKQYAETQF